MLVIVVAGIAVKKPDQRGTTLNLRQDCGETGQIGPVSSCFYSSFTILYSSL